MPKKIPWTIGVTPEGEQAIEKADDMTVDDYYETTVTVHDGSPTTVKIESSSEKPVWLLAIEPQYVVDKPENALTCKFSGTETDVSLVKKLVVVGKGEWKLLRGALDKAPQGLEFTNKTKTKEPLDVKVTVGIGAPAAYPPPAKEDDSQPATEMAEGTSETTSSSTTETAPEGKR